VTDLNDQIVRAVVVQKIPRHTRTLRHPVQPDTPIADAVDVVVAYHCINRGMNLDTCLLAPAKHSADMNIVNDIVGNGAEHRPQRADQAGLLAMRDFVAPHDVMADILLRPALRQATFNRLDVTARCIRRRIVPLIAVLAQRDPRASRIANVVLLDNPPLAPVRADQPDLLSRRRRPRRLLG